MAVQQETRDFLQWHIGQWNRRLRTARTVTWLPRGIMVGATIALVFTAISWLRPWLLPSQLAQISIASIGFFTIGTLLLIWLAPRSVDKAVRDFDLRFHLKERLTTALELIRGDITAPLILTDKQIEDTRIAANKVRANQYLPYKVNRLEVGIVVAMLIILIASLLFDNPNAQELQAQQAFDNTITEQIEDLEQMRDDVEGNSALSEEAQEELMQPLDEALDTLNQDDISQEEAVAALTETEQDLREMSEGLSSEERQANEQAGNDLSSSPLSNELGDKLGDSDLPGSAEESRELSDDLNELNQQEMNELADKLDEAADELRETNPEVSELFEEAAEALRQGDTERAQQALDDAAEAMQNQDTQNRNSEQSQTAQEMADEIGEQRDEVLNPESQDGQQGQEQDQQQQDQQQQQQDQQQQGQQQQDQQQQDQQGEQGQQGQQQEGDQGQQQGQQGQQEGEQGQQEGQQGQQPGQEGQQEGQEGQQGQQGQEGDQGQQGGQAGQEGQQSDSSSSSEGQQSGQPGGAGAGDSGGDAGTDQSGGQQGSINDADDNSPGDNSMRDFEPIYDPNRVGGEGGVDVDLDGQIDESNGEPLNEADFNEDFQGESQVPYDEVFRRYEQSVRDALESDYIPIGVRDIIRSYFSSLEP
ncbi:MAG: hypothetical protein L0154_10765 [Chloroflexi bacterium]|nr:hypothetical protein [Chloroflexota bacterium]